MNSSPVDEEVVVRARLSCSAVLLAATLCVPGFAGAATPSAVTVHASDTQVTFTSLVGGSNPVDRTSCVYGVTCDSLHLTIAAGDYTGKNLVIEIHWLNPASDYDLYCFEGVVDGPNVRISTDSVPDTVEVVPL